MMLCMASACSTAPPSVCAAPAPTSRSVRPFRAASTCSRSGSLTLPTTASCCPWSATARALPCPPTFRPSSRTRRRATSRTTVWSLIAFAARWRCATASRAVTRPPLRGTPMRRTRRWTPRRRRRRLLRLPRRSSLAASSRVPVLRRPTRMTRTSRATAATRRRRLRRTVAMMRTTTRRTTRTRTTKKRRRPSLLLPRPRSRSCAPSVPRPVRPRRPASARARRRSRCSPCC